MRRLWLIGLSLALGAIQGHAQQATPPAEAPVPNDQLSARKINPPKLLNHVEAEFSDEARRKHINGLCVVSLTVDLNGIPQNVKLVRCTDPSFAQGSLKAVAQYRFKPATTQEDEPVAVTIRVVIDFRLQGFENKKPDIPILYGFGTPPGTTSSEPDKDGVYPFTKMATAPSFSVFSDEGYGVLAFESLEGNSSCKINLIISAKGKPSDPQVIHCKRPALEQPAIQLLMKSKYNPGKVNGKAVPMRTSILLELADSPSN